MSQRVDPLNQTTQLLSVFEGKNNLLSRKIYVQYTVSQFSKAFSSVELFKNIFWFFN
jgi:hypothetical protein